MAGEGQLGGKSYDDNDDDNNLRIREICIIVRHGHWTTQANRDVSIKDVEEPKSSLAKLIFEHGRLPPASRLAVGANVDGLSD